MVNAELVPGKTALVFIDPYNDFLSEGGKLWPMVADIARAVNLHTNLRAIMAAARDATAAFSSEAMHAAHAINAPNFAHALVTTAEFLDAFGSVPATLATGEDHVRRA